MATDRTSKGIGLLLQAMSVHDTQGKTDGQLLEQFLAWRDEAAFAALVRRHGSMVRGVCQRVLGNASDADDAFQATFLVLVHKARSLTSHSVLGGWLHGVARRTAQKAKVAAARRRAKERALGRPEAQAEAVRNDWLPLLDEELGRLPEKYRLPIVLCDLEGKTRREAAQQLECPEGTVAGRLARSRALLAKRLIRRVQILSDVVPTALAGRSAEAALPPALVHATVQAAAFAAAGEGTAQGALSPGALTLARGVMQSMFWNKIKIGATALLVAVVSTGASGLTYRVLADLGQRTPAPKPAEKQPESLRSATQETGRQPGPEQPQVALDHYGDPLPERALLRLGTICFRHPGSACAIVLSPDGKSLATHGPGAVRLWDGTTGKPGLVLPCRGEFYGAAQNPLAFSSDGQKLFYLDDEAGVAARNLTTGETQVLLPVAPNTKFHAVHPSPDGRLLAVGTNQGVQMLELASGRSRWSIQKGRDVRGSHDDRLLFHGPYSLGLFAPDGKSVAVNASDIPETLNLLEPASGEERQRVELGARLVRLAFSHDGRKLATTERDNAVRVYDAATGQRLYSWTVKLTNPYENYTSALAFSPDGATLAAGATDHLVHLWDLQTGRELTPLRGHTWNISGLVFAPDGRWLYSVGWDGAIRRWDTATWQEKPVVPNPATGMVARSSVGTVLAWEGDGGVLHLADAATGRNLRTLPGNPAGYSRLAFSPDGSILAAGGNDLSVQLWEVASGKLLRQWSWPKGKDPHACVDDIVFAPDGKTLATAGFRTHEVLLWDVGTGARLGRIGHEMVFGVVFMPDGRTLVTAGWDRAIRWWNLPDLRPLDSDTLPERSKVGDIDGRLHAVRCSPDGRLLATINLGAAFSVWDATTHKLLHSFPATAGQCNIAFSPDGQWLAAGGYHGEVALWEARTGQTVLKLAGHPARVMSVAFGPDGRTLLTGSDDSTGLVWDLRPKIEIRDDPIPALLWDALAGPDASAAYRAIWQLADRPDRSVPFLKGKVTPAKPIDRGRLRELLDNLDSSRFADREAASKELAAWGEAVEAELRRELTQAPSAEKRHRLQALLDGLTAGLSSESVRQVRAVVVLKWANTQEARQLLGELAQGAPEARLTQEAKASLELLSRGAAAAP